MAIAWKRRWWPALVAIAGAAILSRSQAQEVAPFPVVPADRAEAYRIAAEQHLDYLPGEVLVKFKSGVTTDGQNRALLALRSRPDATALQWTGGVALLRDSSQPDARILAAQLGAQPEVLYAQPNYLFYPTRAASTFTPNDPDFAAKQNWNFSAADIPRAWSLMPVPGGDASLIVAVIDTGVTSVPAQSLSVKNYDGTNIITSTVQIAPSPDLDQSRIVSPADFTISTTSPGRTVIDSDSHGTHVASTIAESTNNGINLAGIAFNVKIMPVKVCNSYWEQQFAQSAAGVPGFLPTSTQTSCPDSAIAAGIRYAADNGAKVANISLGGRTNDTILLDALNYAVSKGMFVAISMGNDFESDNHISYPAGFAPQIAGVVSVAAVGPGNTHAAYSTTGTQCEIAAPGGDVTTAGSVGLVYQTTLRQSDLSRALIVPRFDRYEEAGFEGTSMASPHVAGIAALILSQVPALTPAQLESLIEKTALDLGSSGKDSTYGFGLIQAGAALRGFGIAK